MIKFTSEEQYALASASADVMLVNGVCSRHVGLYVDTPPMPPMAEEKMEVTETPYANGDLYGRTGVYSDITLNVRCFVFDGGYHPETIYGFLSGAKKLSFGNAQEYYYVVKKVVGITPQYQQGGKNFLNVQFVCSAFRYRTQNNPIEFTESPARIVLPTNVYCEPVYKLTVDSERTGAAYFKVNDVELWVLNPAIQTGEVVVDIPRKKVYMVADGVYTIVQKYTTGSFWRQVLKPQENVLTWNDHVTAVSVTKNERWL